MNRFSLAAIIPALAFGAGLASAAPASVPGLSPLPQSMPARCADLARVPASARIPGPELAAHVSVANCAASAAMNAVAVSPDKASMARFDAAVAPSLELLDNVIRVGDPYWQAIAEDAKRDLYQGLIVRERSSLQGDLKSHDDLEAMLAPWQRDEQSATEAIAALAQHDPMLAQRDPVIATLVANVPRELQAARVAGLAPR